MTRLKDIQYASRSREHLDDHAHMQRLRRAIRHVGARLDPALAKDPAVRRLLALGCDHSIDIIQLVMKETPNAAQISLKAQGRANGRGDLPYRDRSVGFERIGLLIDVDFDVAARGQTAYCRNEPSRVTSARSTNVEPAWSPER